MRRIILLSTVLLLAACAAPAQPYGVPAFRLAAGDGGSVAVASDVTPAQAGKLTVHFGQVLPTGQRRLLSTLADVDRVVIKLTGVGVDHTQTILQAQIQAGVTSFTFTGLPPGPLTVTIQALDVSGSVLGADTQTATITAGNTTVVASTVILRPTVAVPRVITPNSGTGSVDEGSLTTDVTLQAGTAIVPPLVSTRFGDLADWDVGQLLLTPDGAVWVNTAYSNVAYETGKIYRIPSGGTPIAPSLPADAISPRFVGIAGTTPHVMLHSRSGTYAATLNGDFTDVGYHSYRDIAKSPTGIFWSVTDVLHSPFGAQIVKIDPVTFQPTFFRDEDTDDEQPYKIEVDNQGQLWAAVYRYDYQTTRVSRITLKRFDATNAAAPRLVQHVFEGETFMDLQQDSHGNLWYTQPSTRTLVKMSPAGETLATVHPATRFNRIHIDSQDRVWVYQGAQNSAIVTTPLVTPSADDFVVRVETTGRVAGYYHIGADVDTTELVVDANDHMWVGTGSKGLIELDVTPL